MNIYDISKKAGVSIATVSRVINGNKRVSDKTRAHVLKIIDEHGYTPNAFARGLGLNSMNTVGIMCADSSDPFIAKAIFHLEKALRQNHYDALLCCTGYDLADKEKYMDLLLSKRADAVILVGSSFVEKEDSDNNYIRKAADKIPVMLLNGALKSPNLYSVLCDDHLAVYETTKQLIDNHTNDILYLYNALSYSGNHKLSGFVDGMKTVESDNAQIQQRIHYVDGTIQETRAYLHNLYDSGVSFKAIITSDDTLAVGALKFAKDKDFNVPEDLSIIGYNNSIIATCCEPELSSIDNNVEELSVGCVNKLMQIFNNITVPSQSMYPAKLIERNTTSFVRM